MPNVETQDVSQDMQVLDMQVWDIPFFEAPFDPSFGEKNGVPASCMIRYWLLQKKQIHRNTSAGSASDFCNQRSTAVTTLSKV